MFPQDATLVFENLVATVAAVAGVGEGSWMISCVGRVVALRRCSVLSDVRVQLPLSDCGSGRERDHLAKNRHPVRFRTRRCSSSPAPSARRGSRVWTSASLPGKRAAARAASRSRRRGRRSPAGSGWRRTTPPSTTSRSRSRRTKAKMVARERQIKADPISTGKRCFDNCAASGLRWGDIEQY